MPIIDADTHVDETEETWAYMEQGEQPFRPTTGHPRNPDPSRPPLRYWIIDGKRQLRFVRNDEQTKTTVGTRELIDVDARLRDMDRMGVDIQVMYPTLFLVEFTERPEVALALRRSYNRWMAERWARSGGRLRWVMLPPTMTMEKALEELRFARDHGACGVLKKGDREAGFWPNDPYFFPLYEESERLGMPICFHTGTGVPDFTPARQFTFSSFYRITLPVVHAFQSLVRHEVPARFPRLRFGFIEATASWAPFVLYNLRRTLAKNRERPESPLRGARQDYELSANVLAANRMYISCQVDEDLGYLIKVTGEDNLLMGSDYTHNDAAQEMDFVRLLQQRADQGESRRPPSGRSRNTTRPHSTACRRAHQEPVEKLSRRGLEGDSNRFPDCGTQNTGCSKWPPACRQTGPARPERARPPERPRKYVRRPACQGAGRPSDRERSWRPAARALSRRADFFSTC